MARDYSNKVTLRPPPGAGGPPANPIDVISVAADPNGVITANAGSLALLTGGFTMWRSAGGTVWLLMTSPAGQWTLATLINGWVWTGLGTYQPAYRLTGTGSVELRGGALNPAGVPGGMAMFQLPLAWRSPVDVSVSCAYVSPPAVEAPGTVTIFAATGEVYPDSLSPAGTSVYLDGIFFSILPE